MIHAPRRVVVTSRQMEVFANDTPSSWATARDGTAGQKRFGGRRTAIGPLSVNVGGTHPYDP